MASTMNPLKDLLEEGQSVWLDYIRRSLIDSGDLQRLVDEGVTGVTSNPTIFEKAIDAGDDYDDTLATLVGADRHADPKGLFDQIALADIRDAADALRGVCDSTEGADGFISLEVSPTLADDAAATVDEAHRLWDMVDRPNLMIKVPTTSEGVEAIEELIAAGINVNVTLLFALQRYQEVAQAYLRGIARAREPSRVASVASFFVSRVDTAVDRRLDSIGSDAAGKLRGKAAIANAKLAYRLYQDLFTGEAFAEPRARGARPQRLLWASTGTKDPTYSDVLYIEELVGPDTVNTVPPATLEAFRDHGKVGGPTLTGDVAAAEKVLADLADLGVDLDEVTDELLNQGLEAFTESYHQLLHAIDEKTRKIRSGSPHSQTMALGEYAGEVDARIDTWAEASFAHRLWSKDHTLWSAQPQPEITDRLGWLTLPETMHDAVEDLTDFAEEIQSDGVRHVVLLGMGGSSLAPEVYQKTFGSRPGYPELTVLDSTHPAAVRSVEETIDLSRTLFLVSSKSGTTIEPLSFFRYFWDRMSRVRSDPGERFVAITDPGTPLVELAGEHGFRRVFEATPDVGGRYSALTMFGLVPAALIGVDIHRLLDSARGMSEAAAFCVPETRNPALALGAALGVLAREGRDKATFLVSPSLGAFPSWVEQLIAESTGKDGTGLLPVADEPVGPPHSYGDDRVFVYLWYVGDDDTAQASAIEALEKAGHPVIRIRLDQKVDIAGEMYRAAFAVAVAGAALGIHPFNQPDVQLAKDLARQAMDGELDTDDVTGVAAAEVDTLTDAVGAWLGTWRDGDYIAIQAYWAPTEETTEALQEIRLGLRDRLGAATTLGYGPRFLHSTGQFHKGGPNTGLFLQLVDDPQEDVGVPETDYTFGQLIAAQAAGDLQALRARDRRVLRVQLGVEVSEGLSTLKEVLGV